MAFWLRLAMPQLGSVKSFSRSVHKRGPFKGEKCVTSPRWLPIDHKISNQKHIESGWQRACRARCGLTLINFGQKAQ